MVELNKLYNEDCLELLKRIDDNSVDLVVTSPPYNFDMNYTEYNDNRKLDDYTNFLRSVFSECARVLKDGGRIFVNVQPLFTDNFPTHHIVSQILSEFGLTWGGEIIWEKNNYNCAYTAWGSWMSPSKPYLKYTWEYIEYFFKGSPKHEGNKEDIDITADEFKSWTTAKWSIAPEKRMKEFGHPAMFPEALVERILKLFSYKNDVILDPFMGAGTTAVVCNRLRRNWIGAELSAEYCKVAQNRIKQEIWKGKQEPLW